MQTGRDIKFILIVRTRAEHSETRAGTGRALRTIVGVQVFHANATKGDENANILAQVKRVRYKIGAHSIFYIAAMHEKKFNLVSSRLIALVDFVKWTSTFGEGAIQQMETPLEGVRLSPGLSRLFAVAKDDAGWMVVMAEQEGDWLNGFPVECAFIGFGNEIILVTEEFNALDINFRRLGIGVFVESPDLRETLADETLIGFGIARPAPGGETWVERTGAIVPLYNRERYEDRRVAHIGVHSTARSLFSA